jgi:hypothetical protein
MTHSVGVVKVRRVGRTHRSHHLFVDKENLTGRILSTINSFNYGLLTKILTNQPTVQRLIRPSSCQPTVHNQESVFLDNLKGSPFFGEASVF